MKHSAILLSIPFAALLAGCDNEPTSSADDVEAAPRSEELDAEQPQGHRRGHRQGRARPDPVDRLCAAVDCTDAQRTTLDEAFAAHHRDRPAGDKPRGDRAKFGEALASTFVADKLTVSDLQGLAEAKPPRDHAQRAEVLVDVHAALTAEQRATLAKAIEADGLRGAMGAKPARHRRPGGAAKGPRAGGGPDEGAPHRNRDPQARLDTLCEAMACTPAQAETLAAVGKDLFARRHDRTPDSAIEAANASLATAFASDTFGAAALQTYLEALRTAHQTDALARHQALVTVHDALTPEQRRVFADDFLADRGKRGHHKRHRGPNGGGNAHAGPPAD